jgi:hypothetical protein
MTCRDDARLLLEIMASDPSFRPVPPDRLAAAAHALHIASDGPLDGFALAAMRAMALPCNAHSRAFPDAVLRVVPSRFLWLADGPADVAQAPRRLVAINGMPVAEVFARLRPFIAGPDQRARAIVGPLLAWPAALAFATGDERLAYRFEDATSEADPAALAPWQTLYERRERGIAARLLAAAGLKGYSPFAARLAGAAYVRIADLSPPIGPIAQALADIAARLDSATPLLVDLRGNPGGDFFAAADFVRSLSGRPGPVAALVDRWTFSAAIVTAALLKVHAGARLVGEEMSEGPCFWAEGGWTSLPASGLAIRHSDGWHDWRTGRADPVHTPPAIAAAMVAAGSLLPDVEVSPTSADLAAGRDPALAAALADVTSR